MCRFAFSLNAFNESGLGLIGDPRRWVSTIRAPVMAINVASWLKQLGLAQYEPAFRDNEVDGEVLPDLATLPRITAPASRSAATLAASRPVRQPTNRGEPWNAPTAGSNSSACERQRSRNSRGVSLPAAKFAAAEKNGMAAAMSSRHSITPGEIRKTLSHIRRSAQTPAWSEGHSDGSSGLGRLKQTSLARISMPSEIQM